MWLFTENGFYSVVRHDPNLDRHPQSRAPQLVETEDDLLLVRTRDRGDMERLRDELPQVEFSETERADYRFRALLARSEWLEFLEHEIENLDYRNFKDRVTSTLGHERHDLLMSVWSVMRRLQASAP